VYRKEAEESKKNGKRLREAQDIEQEVIAHNLTLFTRLIISVAGKR
jgi:hypothetical protein